MKSRKSANFQSAVGCSTVVDDESKKLGKTVFKKKKEKNKVNALHFFFARIDLPTWTFSFPSPPLHKYMNMYLFVSHGDDSCASLVDPTKGVRQGLNGTTRLNKVIKADVALAADVVLGHNQADDGLAEIVAKSTQCLLKLIPVNGT